jgi:hypothetical protein
MQRRPLAAATLLVTALVLGSATVLHLRDVDVPLNAARAAATPPPLPADIVSRTGPTSIDGKRCTQTPGHLSEAVDIWNIETLRTLYGRTDEIVLADAVRQVAYWQHRFINQRIEWAPATLTQYHVVTALKGTPQPWINISDIGASSTAISTCRNLAYTILTDPLPTLGRRYVLFIQFNPELGGRPVADASRRFPVVDGTVSTEAAAHSAASRTVVQPFSPMPLHDFVGYVGSLASR